MTQYLVQKAKNMPSEMPPTKDSPAVPATARNKAQKEKKLTKEQKRKKKI